MTLVAEAFVRLRPDTTTFRAEAAAGIGSSLSGANTAALGLGKGAIRASAGILGITTAATLGAVALKEIIGGAAAFEQELDVLAVVSGATAAEMERVGQAAKDLGADITLPGISAGDAAVAMNELAKSGLSITDTLGGARGALQLAAAAEIEVGEAASIAGSALNVFGLQGDQATHVADLLAGASIAAQGEVTDMAMSLQQAGTVSAQAGLSIEQTVGAIALLAKNGLLGSDAGTSLRTTLLRLIPTTKEAKQYTDALGISIDETRTLGDQLPEVIEQYRNALSKLNPVLQQQALTQIFGSDAIRGASILIREGADGYDRMTNAVDRTGAANELATARTEGLTGTFEGLKSQLSTLAIELGETVVPGLTEVTAGLAEVTAGAIELVETIKSLNQTKINLPGFGGQDDNNDDDDLGRLQRPFTFLKDQLNDLVGYEKDITSLRDTMKDLRPPDILDLSDARRDAKEEGKEVGKDFVAGVAAGIETAEQIAVTQARASLAQVIRQGKEAVAGAIASAQQALTSLGSRLAADAASVIDTGAVSQRIEEVAAGATRASAAASRARQSEAIRDARADLDQALRDAPIEREIRRLQEGLDRANRRDDRRDISRTLRDAQEDLAEARLGLGRAGPRTAAGNAEAALYLRPFLEGVKDAKTEVGRFNTEATIEKLQARLDGQTDDISGNIGRLRESLADAKAALVESQESFATEGLVTSLRSAAEAQKEAVTTGIADSIQAFNDGLITLPQLNVRLAKLLAANGVDYKNAGTKLGTAFVRGFEETLASIGAQAVAILAGPQDPGAGLRGRAVSPLQAARDAGIATATAKAALDTALLAEAESASGSLERIEALIRGGNPVGNPKDGAVIPFTKRRSGKIDYKEPYHRGSEN